MIISRCLPRIITEQKTTCGDEEPDHDGRGRGAGDIVGFVPTHGNRHGGRRGSVKADADDAAVMLSSEMRTGMGMGMRSSVWRETVVFDVSSSCGIPSIGSGRVGGYRTDERRAEDGTVDGG